MSNLNGRNSDQLPNNGELGRLAFQSPAGLVVEPQASVTPAAPGDMVFQLTSNTTLTVKVRGLDGVVRSAALTLA